MTWDESKHPRDSEGKFTFKEGGMLKGGIEKTEGIGTGAHLHLGARKNGEKINPIDIIGNVYPKK